MNHIKKNVFFALLGALSNLSATAKSEYLTAWEAKYPDVVSSVGTAQCQICHAENPGSFAGGWNAYGWEVRDLLTGFDISTSLLIAEFTDLDHDPIGATSIVEINNGTLPGWTSGPNNTIYKPNGTELNNQLPPNFSSAINARLDLPPKIVDNQIPTNIEMGSIDVNLEVVAEDFEAPLHATVAPGVADTLFVVEQTGKIIQVNLNTGTKTPFLNTSASLVTLNNNYDERGLLGLAFHPDYASNGLFYTNQSEPVSMANADFSTLDAMQIADHRTKIVEYSVSNPLTNPIVSRNREILVIDQPQHNHNGGMLTFGPDGYLYIGLGDGGGSDDVGDGHDDNGNGRDNTNPLGSILRIDPLGSNSSNGKYGIPSSNPFTAMGNEGLDEIFAYGLRNPYRFSFDAQDGTLYAADIGQNAIEEINIINSGENYGWNYKEGSYHFFTFKNYTTQQQDPQIDTYVSNQGLTTTPVDLVEPIAEYDHDEGISITGGYVYRGNEVSDLAGRYVFADWNKRLFYLDPNNQIKELQTDIDVDFFVTGFAQDHDNALYVISNNVFTPTGNGGKLYKIATKPEPVDDELCFPIKAANGSVAVICL